MNSHPDQDVSWQQAFEQYRESRRTEVEDTTLRQQCSALKTFIRFVQENEISMDDLNGFYLESYYNELQNQGKAPVTLRTYMSNVFKFIEYLERVELVEQGLSEKVHKPSLNKDDEVRDSKIEPERLQAVVKHLEKFRYASRDHVILLLLWRTGMRRGALHSLDVDDLDTMDGNPVLRLEHRPDTRTRLKNGVEGERPVNVSGETFEVLEDYIEFNREQVEDDFGRRPLLTSGKGRYGKSSIADTVYYYTCPSVTGVGECSCPDDLTRSESRKCEMSVSPHVIRSASISHWRNQDVNVEIVSDRMDVSPDGSWIAYFEFWRERCLSR